MVRRTHGACVTSVLCARVLVCKAQSSERGRGSGEAKLGARHASLRAFLFAQEQNREADILSLRETSWILPCPLLGAAAATATPVATLHVDGHGAQAIHGGSKRKEEDQNDGSTASSTRAARRR